MGLNEVSHKKGNGFMYSPLRWAAVLAVVGWLMVTTVFLADSSPPTVGLGGAAGLSPVPGDLLGHLALFAILGAVAMVGSSIALPSLNLAQRSALVAAIGISWGIATEWYQTYVPGRDGNLEDLLFDFLGVAAGLSLAWTLSLWRGRYRRAVLLPARNGRS